MDEWRAFAFDVSSSVTDLCGVLTLYHELYFSTQVHFVVVSAWLAVTKPFVGLIALLLARCTYVANLL